MKSYVTVSVFGVRAQEYLNELFKIMSVKNIKNKDDVIYFEIRPHKYKSAATLASRFGLRTRVEDRRGLYFKLRPYRKRYGIIFGCAAFFGVITLLSNFIWDIRVSGNTAVSSAQIKEVLEKHGISSGVLINSYDDEKAELAAVLELDKLAWVSIERTGSRINVKVSERLEAKEPEISIKTPCNITAGKSGVIVETEVYRGALLIEKGSGVHRGDVIVSGIVEDGAGNIILSHASAKIIAECVDEAQFFMPFNTIERKHNGKVSKNNFMVFLGHEFPLFLIDAEREKSTYREETRAPRFLGFRLPIRLKTGFYSHYDLIEVQIGQAKAISRLKSQIENYRRNFHSDSEIISFDETFSLREDGVEANVKIVYRTDIAVKREIGIP